MPKINSDYNKILSEALEREEHTPLQCPFCGANGETFQIPTNDKEENMQHPKWVWNDPGMWLVGCWTDGCLGNINNKARVFISEDEAIQAWNRRYRG